MDYTEELVECQQHVISLCQEHEFFWVIWTVWMSLLIAQLKLPNFLVVQGNRYKKLGMRMMLPMLAG
jgi:hypothetical protein